jgi:hypothetical protein
MLELPDFIVDVDIDETSEVVESYFTFVGDVVLESVVLEQDEIWEASQSQEF